MDFMLQNAQNTPTEIFKCPDGRKIAFLDFGDPNGIPIFYFHGSPASRLEALIFSSAAENFGFRFISMDRPGMGLSDFKKSYTLLEYNKDLIMLAEHLNLEKFGVIGTSGGGTTLMALCYEHPNRIMFAVDLCGWAPIWKTGLAKDMAPLDRFFSRFAESAPKLFKYPFKLIDKQASSNNPQKLIKLIKSSLSGSDAEFVKEENVARFLSMDIKEAFRQGSEGPSWDAILRYVDWGFEIEDIKVPIWLFHGTDDKFVPLSFLKYKQQHLAHWEYKEYPGKGHLFLMTKADEILQFISEKIKS